MEKSEENRLEQSPFQNENQNWTCSVIKSAHFRKRFVQTTVPIDSRQQLKQELEALEQSPSPPRKRLQRVITTESVLCMVGASQRQNPEDNFLNHKSVHKGQFKPRFTRKENIDWPPPESVRLRIKRLMQKREKEKTSRLNNFLKMACRPSSTQAMREVPKRKATLCSILC